MTGDNNTSILPIGEYSLEEDKIIDWIWGYIHFQTYFKSNQLWVRKRLLESDSEVPDSIGKQIKSDFDNEDEDIEWIRWPLGKSVKSIKLNAITPDLPYVIRIKYPIFLQPGQSVEIVVSIPSWLKLLANTADKELELHEFSTVPLQKTWFGSPLEGELCYWRETQALIGSLANDTKTYYISCPVRIRNASDEILNFKQFNLRVEELTIFRKEEQLWGDEIRIDFKGQTLSSEISNTGKLPKYLDIKNPQIISRPRKHTRKSITRRTFNLLLNI